MSAYKLRAPAAWYPRGLPPPRPVPSRYRSPGSPAYGSMSHAGVAWPEPGISSRAAMWPGSKPGSRGRGSAGMGRALAPAARCSASPGTVTGGGSAGSVLAAMKPFSPQYRRGSVLPPAFPDSFPPTASLRCLPGGDARAASPPLTSPSSPSPSPAPSLASSSSSFILAASRFLKRRRRLRYDPLSNML